MKTYIYNLKKYTLAGFSALMLLAGCEDNLEIAPISTGSVTNFYRTEKDFLQAVNGAYNGLRTYPLRHFFLSEVRSDNIYSPGEETTYEFNQINNFIVNSQTPTVAAAWTDCYVTILRTNEILNRINEQNVAVEATRNQFTGEAKFIRALMYFDLVRFYGQVPLVTQATTSAEALNIGQSSVADVYTQIIEDLTDAIALLPATYNAANAGRATSGAAKALLAQVYMTRSGPVQHPEGPTLNANEYDKAKALLSEIIASNRYSFINNYSTIFTTENNSESVFEIQFKNGGSGIGSVYPSETVTTGYLRSIGANFAGGVGNKDVSPDLISSYATNDVRRAFNIQFGYTDELGNFVNRNTYKKFININQRGTTRDDWGTNYPVIRYTDVLLMYAETLLRTGGSQNEVDQIVNRVRTRAGVPTLTGVTLDMLLEERRREFAGEGLRWHDLVRTGKMVEVMNAWALKDDTKNVIRKPITVNDVLYPIPQSELLIKPDLYEQNLGY